MKVLVLQDDFPPKSMGGAGIIAFYFAKAMREKGHEVSVITAVQDKADEGELDYEGLKIFRIYSKYHARWQPYLSLYNPRTVSKVERIINQIKPDIVHAHNIHYHLSYHALKLAKESGAKVFLTVHDVMLFHYGKLPESISAKGSSSKPGSYKVSVWQQIKMYKKRYNPFRNIIINYYIKNVDNIIACCTTLAEVLRQNGIKDVRVLHNGINVKDFNASQESVEEFRKKHNLNGKKILFFGGRISKSKGGDLALNLLIEVSKIIPNVCLVIAGRVDEYVSTLVDKASRAGVGDKIKTLGWLNRDEIVPAYLVSDVVLSIALYMDSFPTVNLEAMATKKPVIGSCYSGTKEAVVDGETGYVVDPRNEPLLIARTIELLKNDSMAKKFGQAGFDRVVREYDLVGQADKLESIYKS